MHSTNRTQTKIPPNHRVIGLTAGPVADEPIWTKTKLTAFPKPLTEGKKKRKRKKKKRLHFHKFTTQPHFHKFTT